MPVFLTSEQFQLKQLDVGLASEENQYSITAFYLNKWDFSRLAAKRGKKNS